MLRPTVVRVKIRERLNRRADGAGITEALRDGWMATTETIRHTAEHRAQENPRVCACLWLAPGFVAHGSGLVIGFQAPELVTRGSAVARLRCHCSSRRQLTSTIAIDPTSDRPAVKIASRMLRSFASWRVSSVTVT